MKKTILAMTVAAFGFAASAQAEGTCIDPAASRATMSEAAILDALVAPECGMSLNDAVNAIINAGGNQTATLAAALIINPDYSYAAHAPFNPTPEGETAAGGEGLGGSGGSGSTITFASNAGSSGGGGGVSP